MKKDVIAILLVALVVALLISGTNIQSVEEYYRTNTAAREVVSDDDPYVTVSIVCHVLNKEENYAKLDDALKDEKYVPTNGVILAPTKYKLLTDSDSVYDVLSFAVRANRIEMVASNQNSYATVYVSSINHLREYSAGELSGWTYSVNGAFPQVGCDKCVLHGGDVVVWAYTCDLGRDVGDDSYVGGGK